MTRALPNATNYPARWREDLVAIFRSPALAVWCFFLLTTPIYLFDSGLPQPGDLLVFLLVPFSLLAWNGRLERAGGRAVRSLLTLTLWVCAVNVAWAAVLSKWELQEFLIFPFFYVFNAAVFVCALILARPNPERFLRITVAVVSVTILYQVISTFLIGGSSRGQAFFNNPNQLGFYAVMAACLLAMAQRPLNMGRLIPALGVTGCAYLAMLSASRSAVAGILVLLFLMLFSNPRTILVASLAAAGLVNLGGPVSDAIDESRKRAFEDRHPDRTFVEERGIDRMSEHPEYLVLGAGEGDVTRFRKHAWGAGEIHNSYGSLVFCYGVVGFALFLMFLIRVVRGAPLRMTLMLVPVGVYMIAHNGMRSTTLWVLFALFMLLKKLDPIAGAPVQGTATKR